MTIFIHPPASHITSLIHSSRANHIQGDYIRHCILLSMKFAPYYTINRVAGIILCKGGSFTPSLIMPVHKANNPAICFLKVLGYSSVSLSPEPAGTSVYIPVSLDDLSACQMISPFLLDPPGNSLTSCVPPPGGGGVLNKV